MGSTKSPGHIGFTALYMAGNVALHARKVDCYAKYPV
jgi:hypothetical protein